MTSRSWEAPAQPGLVELCESARTLICSKHMILRRDPDGNALFDVTLVSVGRTDIVFWHMDTARCEWVGSDDLMIAYHDAEWGVPLHDDRKLFEFIVLDAMQAGLSWRIVLQKRENFKRALDHFDFRKVAKYRDSDMARLMGDPGIIRNRQKLAASITNARGALELQKEFGSLSDYFWGFVGDKPIVNSPQSEDEIPATSPEAQAMSRDLAKRGFKFVGPTICYAFMQAAGLVNDHLTGCFRYRELKHSRTAS